MITAFYILFLFSGLASICKSMELQHSKFSFNFPLSRDVAVYTNCTIEDNLPPDCRKTTIYIAGWMDSLEDNKENVYYCSEYKESYVLRSSVSAWDKRKQETSVSNYEFLFDEYSCVGLPDNSSYSGSLSDMPFAPPFKHQELSVAFGSAVTTLTLTVSLIHLSSGTKISDSTMQLITVAPIDVGVDTSSASNLQRPREMSNFQNSKLDFVEIGTSNFDTCLQMVHSLKTYKESTTCKNSDDTCQQQIATGFKGLSIDAVEYYLRDLPQVDGIEKLNVAINVDSSQPVAIVYHYPYSFLGQTLNSSTAGGMSTVNRIVPVPITGDTMESVKNLLVREYITTLKFMRRLYIPSMSVEELLIRFVETRGTGINLLKVDLEVSHVDTAATATATATATAV